MPKMLTLNQYEVPSKSSKKSTILIHGLSLSNCPSLSEKNKGLATTPLSYESSSKPQKPEFWTLTCVPITIARIPCGSVHNAEQRGLLVNQSMNKFGHKLALFTMCHMFTMKLSYISSNLFKWNINSQISPEVHNVGIISVMRYHLIVKNMRFHKNSHLGPDGLAPKSCHLGRHMG